MATLLNRRRFLEESAIIVVASGSSLSAGAPLKREAGRNREHEEAPKRPIVDTHQHLWDLSRFRLPWQKAGSPLAKSFLMNDYLQATKGLNVTKAVYMEVDLEPSQQEAEAEFVIALCKAGNTPTVAGVISGRPDSDEFEKYIRKFSTSPYIKGVRQVLHYPEIPAGLCLHDRFVKSVRLLGELGMSFDICIRQSELLDGAKLIDLCPDTRFILDHCGNPNVRGTPKERAQWERGIGEVASRKNVVVKISGILASVDPSGWSVEQLAPFINHTGSVFGPDRVMFGGDWPVCTLAATYKQWLEVVQTVVHDRAEIDQRKLFHDNAVGFYGL
jgi:predicted TIM-barrel fold metal-dependent hydrolase